MTSYRICNRCVMDTSAVDIAFDEVGYCNYCNEYLATHDSHHSNQINVDVRDRKLAELVTEIRLKGEAKPYDCIVGVSGGVDSSWVLVNAVRLGLRPLAVHMDNGWNSNLAVSNIANLIETLGVDLYTHVIEWNEYRSLMEAFFASDVIDIELLYDNALHEVCYSQAKKYGLEAILSGSNFSTEGLRMPPGWAWESKWDGRNIRRIGRLSGARIRTFPLFTTYKWVKYTFINKIRWEPFLDLLDYRKDEALEVLERDYGYSRYPYKHYESVFTRFYQGFILPSKFGVDKRRPHLSSLIASSQISRDEAILDLNGIPYPSERELEIDRKFFLKKMGWDDQKLQDYLARPEIPHQKYGSDLLRAFLIPISRILRKLGVNFGQQ